MAHIPAGRDLDTVTVEDWRAATKDERRAFIHHWASQGHVSFQCLSCGYPTHRGVAQCAACSPEEIRAHDAFVRKMVWEMVDAPVPPIKPWDPTSDTIAPVE